MNDLKARIRLFVEERDWQKFHSPKNLATGLAIESSELLEIFLWLSDDESRQLDETQMSRLRDEIGDVMVYLVNLADKFGLDPLECALDKLAKNALKYPVELVKGSSKKYSEY